MPSILTCVNTAPMTPQLPRPLSGPHTLHTPAPLPPPAATPRMAAGACTTCMWRCCSPCRSTASLSPTRSTMCTASEAGSPTFTASEPPESHWLGTERAEPSPHSCSLTLPFPNHLRHSYRLLSTPASMSCARAQAACRASVLNRLSILLCSASSACVLTLPADCRVPHAHTATCQSHPPVHTRLPAVPSSAHSPHPYLSVSVCT